MPNKQPNQQGIAWPKAAIRGFSGSLPSAPDYIVSKNCTKWFTNYILLRNTYTFYLHGHRCYVRTYSCLDVIMLYSEVLRGCLKFFFFSLMTYFTAQGYLPVRPSFRLSDGHEGQEVVSNF